MHRTPIITGLMTTMIFLLVVLTLASGFGVDLTQAVSQALPVLVATGVAVALGMIVVSRELA
jgi:mannose/fructose/N-acetylgalactosamine-specific phosphotransferase system component IIC